MLSEMEAVDGNKLTSETLGGVSLSSNEAVKPGSEERAGDVESEVLCGGAGGGDAVVVTETEVSVVKVIQEGKQETEGTIVKNQESEVQESEKDGVFGNFVGDGELKCGGNVKGSLACENASEIQEGKEETENIIVKNQESEVQETEKEGFFGNFVGDGDVSMKEVEEDKEEMVGTIVKNQENEVQETEKERVFGNFVGDGDDNMKEIQEDKEETEGTNVKNQENEIQERENEGLFGNFVGDDDKDSRVKCHENGVSTKGCLSDDKTTKHENGTQTFGSNEETGKNDEENVKHNGLESAEIEDESEGEEEEDHDFITGDFVWGKIKSHPWWPGQVYDPSDASDFAAKFKRKGRLLVAYFGDGSFSWCSPSQLKPFVNHFDEMAKQSNSKNFVNAVQNALNEVCRLVESELLAVDRIENDKASNSGIKAGVFVPKGNTVRVLIDRMGPVELLSILKASATMEFEKLLDLDLDLTVVRSCLSAFYKRKGGYFLPVFHEPKCIEGLEDKVRTGSVSNVANVTNSDINGPVENTDDKLYQGRKQKSVAELLGEVEDNEPKIKKAKTTKDGSLKKRKVAVPVPPESPESDHESGGSAGYGGEEELTSPRQRKKSKYLSPPYTNPIWGGRVSGYGSFKEPKPDTEKDKDSEAGEKRVHESSGKKPRQKRRSREESDFQESEEHKKKIMDTALSVSKMLNGLLRAALDPSSTNENKNLTAISEFVSSFRSSIFKDGSNEENKDSSVTLVVEFPSGVSLPTKTDLLKTYRKFGDLVKKETRVLNEGPYAFVVFVNGSEAEAALNMSLEKKPFGGVKYYLAEETGHGNGSGLGFVKKKVEEMMEMVKKSEEGEMSEEMKAKLEEGMKEVLEKVSKME